MYRFHFDCTAGKWVIQFLKFGMVWREVDGKEFDRLDEAKDYVKAKGINDHYNEQVSPKGRDYNQIFYGQGAAR